MFENYMGAKQNKRRKWVGITVTISVVLHVIVVGALIVRSFWVIEKLAPPDREVSMGAPAPPPPPPPPPPAGASKPVDTTKPIKVKATDVVQPTESDPDEDIQVVSDTDYQGEGDPNGVPGGVEGGVAGGQLGGQLGGMLGGVGDGPPPPPPPPSEPEIVPPQALEERRISGEKQIVPSDEIKLQIKRDAHEVVLATFQICISENGSVAKMQFMKKTGYPGYDAKIREKVMQWRYRPFTVNGTAVKKCSAVTLVYKQKN